MEQEEVVGRRSMGANSPKKKLVCPSAPETDKRQKKLDSRAPPCRILVVDDEPSFLELMQTFLRQPFLIVRAASNGLRAQKLLDQEKFDLVITDHYMPGLDGLSLLRWIKKKKPTIDVILMSGDTSLALQKEARKEGAVDFLAKPFSSQRLFNALHRYCRKQTATSADLSLPLP